MPLEVFNFDLDYPLKIEYLKKVRIREPIEGARQSRIDRATRRKIEISSNEFDKDSWISILDFWNRHYPDKSFIFHKLDTDEQFECYFSSDLKSDEKGYNNKDFSLVIEEKNPMPDDFQDPTTPGITLSSANGNLTVAITTPSTDNVGVTEYEIEILPDF